MFKRTWLGLSRLLALVCWRHLYNVSGTLFQFVSTKGSSITTARAGSRTTTRIVMYASVRMVKWTVLKMKVA